MYKFIVRVSIAVLTLLFIPRCIDVKNRVKVIGGSYRLVSATTEKTGDIVTIKPASRQDSVLGIGILLNTIYVADGSEKTFLINAHTQGMKGVQDTIDSLYISTLDTHIARYLQGDSSRQKFFMKKSNLVLDKQRYEYASLANTYIKT